MAQRKIHWSQDQEKRLAECSIYMSENNQTGDSFWDRALNRFNNDEPFPFNKNDLLGKWSVMSKAIPVFIKCWDRANRDRASVDDERDVYWKAECYFYAEEGILFQHQSAWEVLKNDTKFINSYQNACSSSST